MHAKIFKPFYKNSINVEEYSFLAEIRYGAGQDCFAEIIFPVFHHGGENHTTYFIVSR